MGTPEFAVEGLRRLLLAGQTGGGVITAPDRPAGRGRKLRPSAVKQFAQAHGLNVLQPTNLKDPVFLDDLRALGANLQVVVAFRMLPKQVWQMPEYGTFNLHASLLPQYRGAAPINWAIINGETETGVTTFFIDEKIDTGAMILQEHCSIGPEDTVGELHDRLMELGADLIVQTVERIAQGPVSTQIQPHMEALKPAPKLSKENTRIDWSQPLQAIFDQIRGLDPYPAAWTVLNNGGDELALKIYTCSIEPGTHGYEPLRLVTSKKEIKVALPDGFLNLHEIQLPGKRRMEAQAVLNGFSFEETANVV